MKRFYFVGFIAEQEDGQTGLGNAFFESTGERDVLEEFVREYARRFGRRISVISLTPLSEEEYEVLRPREEVCDEE